ncbi:hypothetical protein DdX_14268 [Ditylenchus destructor]|uniref:Uncharacterized protein n=1 Tax=Ditylenchus destructor TaxID=166010 RepID=A0AAD4MXC6_9BILA|nr:hypothetical protein DdX_14268 [Ditylenchus destructor]
MAEQVHDGRLEDEIHNLKRKLHDMFKSKMKYKKLYEEAGQSHQASSSREMATSRESTLEQKCMDLEMKVKKAEADYDKLMTTCISLTETLRKKEDLLNADIQRLNDEIQRLKTGSDANCSSAEDETGIRKIKESSDKLERQMRAEIYSLKDELHKAYTDLDESNKAQENLKSSLEGAEDDIQIVNEKDEEIANIKKDLQNMLAYQESQSQAYQVELQRLTAENHKLEKQLDLQQTYDSNMSALKEDLRNERIKASNLRGELSNANRKAQKANIRATELGKERALLQAELDWLRAEFQTQRPASDNSVPETIAQNEKLANYENIIGQLKNEVAELREMLTKSSASILEEEIEEIQTKNDEDSPIILIPGVTSRQRQSANRNLTATKVAARERSESPTNAVGSAGPRRSRRDTCTPNRFIACANFYRPPQGNNARKRNITPNKFEQKEVAKRPRGRPKSLQPRAPMGNQDAAAATRLKRSTTPNKTMQITGAKRPRGRTKSVQPVGKQNHLDARTGIWSNTLNSSTSNDKPEEDVVKRPRGRPRKNSFASSVSMENIQVALQKEKVQRKRSATPFRNRSRSKSQNHLVE